MSKHSKKAKKEKRKKAGQQHRERKAAPSAKSKVASVIEPLVRKDEHGNIIVATKTRLLHKSRSSAKGQSAADWNNYVSGGTNFDGARIDDVLARNNHYIVYLQGNKVVVEGDAGTLRNMDHIASLVARINLPANPLVVRTSNVEIARAYDLCLGGLIVESKAVLNQLLARLEGSQIAMARLHYLWAGIVTSAICWLIIFICYASGSIAPNHLLWFKAIAIGGTGGFFAVALSQSSISIDLSHSTLVHWTAGVARILVAMAAALVVLLAIKGGIFMGVAEKAAAGYPELFFCFLAGFSETFVQKLLRDNENEKASSAPVPSDDGIRPLARLKNKTA